MELRHAKILICLFKKRYQEKNSVAVKKQGKWRLKQDSQGDREDKQMGEVMPERTQTAILALV